MSPFDRTDDFVTRHVGPRPSDIAAMLATLDCPDLDALVDQAVPAAIRRDGPLALAPPMGEQEVLARMRQLADQNHVFRSLIGMGYHDTVTPPVIQRNILENPGWYTQYTPYQAEIAQGRLEALVNFQTMVADLTGLPLANSSLLDEATAAAEAMAMCFAAARKKRRVFWVADDCHPQTIAVVQTRAEPIDIEVRVVPVGAIAPDAETAGVLVQYPTTHGRVCDFRALAEATHAAGALVVAATDLLALALLTPPGEWGADIAIGSSQRFGVPLGYGGPHAGFLSTHSENARNIPGRIVGISRDARGKPAYRLALQTREQHIRRDRATSNICTAQVLLAIMAGMYAVYHGPEGIKRIATRVHALTQVLALGLRKLGFELGDDAFFDTLSVATDDAEAIVEAAMEIGINLRLTPGRVGIALDETCDLHLLDGLFSVFAEGEVGFTADEFAADVDGRMAPQFARESGYLSHPVFNTHRAEHAMLRYIHQLQGRDLSLTTSMIPLGSCTMKLNATTEMIPVTWPEFGAIHPFAPPEQALGYATLFRELEAWLAEITGFAAVSLQPNAGSQGEYAGLLAIRAAHKAADQAHRNICLIPTSAHGTNPASAVMAGMKVVTVKCDARGDIDMADLAAKAAQHAEHLAALMVTYPSTHGVFEEGIASACEIIHRNGGYVYMDGANMNAQVGLCRPGDMGADVCHLNLHKTFCIPHGGGGPGMGPIGVTAELAPYLPGHPALGTDDAEVGAIAAAPYGSPGILPISYAYIALMGGTGLTQATRVAILNANYMAARLREHYEILFTGANGRVAHEFIIDARGFKASAGIAVDDIAKRLMDYGFHAPTMSFPVAGTLMIEPTESETREELDRFCDAMIAIRDEIRAIAEGKADREDNPLRNAPHTAAMVTATEWGHAYPREQAAWPLPYVRENKFWPAVARVDNAYGDRNLMCTCLPIDAYSDE